MGLLGSQAQVAPADLTVPAADSAANTDIADVIGNKTDTYDGNSLYSYIDSVHDSIASKRQVRPTLTAGATVVSATGDWTYGNYAVVVPASTITTDFHIHGVAIESCNKNAVFQLELYKGTGDDVVAAVRFAVIGGFFGNQVYVIGSEHIEANSQIRARVASSDGAANPVTMTISIVYWEHT